MNRAIITGGGGFVGRAIVSILHRRGVDCTVIGRSRYPDLESQGVHCLRGDVSDREFLREHLRDADVVFHVAAIAGIWGAWHSFYTTNVKGTANVIDACLANKIGALVHTSTPSVVFSGDDIVGGDESLPYADRFLCGYAKSKAAAEKMVLDIDQQRLRSCALRPHLIWGPGDPHLIPRLLQRGRQRSLKIVGNGTNIVDITYIDDVALAHVQAADSLLSRTDACGRAYFIGGERPVQLWLWINELFGRMHIDTVKKKVPLAAAYTAGTMLEAVHSVFKPEKEPAMTRFLALQLAKSHCFSHRRAQQDFGYTPQIAIEEGMERLVHWLKRET